MTEETTQEIKRFDPYDNAEEWERYIEDRAYRRYEHQIKCLQEELRMERMRNDAIMKQLVSIELLKPPAPIVIPSNNTVKTPYELCGDGPFCPFRDHDTEFGWGIRHRPTGRVFGYVGDKGCAFGTSAALNGHFEAAKVFMGHSRSIEDEYFKQFKEG